MISEQFAISKFATRQDREEAMLKEIEKLRAERDAWRDYAQHQEHCAVCGEAVSDCYDGSALRHAALAKIEGEK